MSDEYTPKYRHLKYVGDIILRDAMFLVDAARRAGAVKCSFVWAAFELEPRTKWQDEQVKDYVRWRLADMCDSSWSTDDEICMMWNSKLSA